MKLRIALTTMTGLTVAMGLGRFALTPQLPRMLAEGQVNLTQASLVAAANFLGYLLGAVEITLNRKHHQMAGRLKAGLWGSGIILILSVLIPAGTDGVYVNMFLRFAAGVASAWVMVLLASWVQHELKENHALRSIAFAGPGVGIFLSGILAIGFDYAHTSAAFNWLIYGVAALILSGLISGNLPKKLPQAAMEERFTLSSQVIRLVFIYVLFAMGYVLPATFLSKLAVDQFPHSLIASVFWPLFGLAVVAGMALLATQRIGHPQRWLAAVLVIQGIGILACVYIPGMAGLLIGTLCVGGPFMYVMHLMMQLGMRLTPRHIRTFAGMMTIGFALGQFLGPVLSAFTTHYLSSMTPALLIAAGGSFSGAILAYTFQVPHVNSVGKEKRK